MRFWMEIIVCVCIVVSNSLMPLWISQTHPIQEQPLYITMLVFDFLYLINIIANCFTGFVSGKNHQYVVLNKRNILWRYAKTWLFVDAVVLACNIIDHKSKKNQTLVVAIVCSKVLRIPILLIYFNNIAKVLRMGLLVLHCSFKYMIAFFGTESARAKYYMMSRQVEAYMNNRRFPPRIKKKVLKFYAIRFQSHFFVESRMMACVSGQLRNDMVMYTGRQLVRELFFLKQLPRLLLMEITLRFKLVIFIEGDIIFKIHTIGDEIYFIHKGTVAIYSESGREVCHLEDGEYFGGIALVMKHRLRTASAVAVTNCELFMGKEDIKVSGLCEVVALQLPAGRRMRLVAWRGMARGAWRVACGVWRVARGAWREARGMVLRGKMSPQCSGGN
ncbi:hypothetical protein MSG28_010119 [Choristoneura fumiferana]|uniref:Uncharacterized protein n=1 Tax=Choristoneura fumiferana TaxID=7141 RepID=A0ACC0KJY8_CHOFU|nr:hypothetical protein MSG28_010119 [Choristoneura fumiferana]